MEILHIQNSHGFRQRLAHIVTKPPRWQMGDTNDQSPPDCENYLQCSYPGKREDKMLKDAKRTNTPGFTNQWTKSRRVDMFVDWTFITFFGAISNMFNFSFYHGPFFCIEAIEDHQLRISSNILASQIMTWMALMLITPKNCPNEDGHHEMSTKNTLHTKNISWQIHASIRENTYHDVSSCV